MDLHPQLLQFLGSLAAIFALAGIALALKLGPEPRLKDEDEARRVAEEAVDGFAASAVTLDRDGRGALLTDVAGQILLLRPHGSHFAARILTPAAEARIEGDQLVVDTAEKRYGVARLIVPDAPTWVHRIELMG